MAGAINKTLHDTIYFNNYAVNIYVYIEKRSNSRVSLCKTGVIIRLPKGMNKHEKNFYISKYTDWANQKLQEIPDFFERKKELYKDYSKINELKLFGQTYSINFLVVENREKISIKNNEIHILAHIQRSKKEISETLARALAKFFNSYMVDKVDVINRQHFQVEVKKVRFRNNKRVWGSCSSRGNLSFSTRLLLCPEKIVDYLIVHELAHFIHRDHSSAYWKCVESVMPDYRESEAWLKKYGANTYF
ncbi:MAG: M48 family peptidase [Chitinophagaceae bacterium]|nr:MAG: M48 family peptidase [Chitinophagaceae bacterium]